MVSHSSKKVIYAALASNLAIAVIKGLAATWTGSSAMACESIHSLVDTCNQWLMLLGLSRATRPADERYPFGYGRELYFWVFVVGLLIFAGGGIVSIAEGFEKVMHPTPVVSAWINYVVLGAAIAIETNSFLVAQREFQTQKGTLGYLEAMRSSKDPTVFAVLLEDVAALAGLLVAAAGIMIADLLNLPMVDGLASLGVGAILIGVSVFLVAEAKGLLIGEAASPDLVAAVRTLALRQPGVEAVSAVLTQHLGPADVLVNISLDFCDSESAGFVERTVAEIEREIKDKFPEVTRLFVEIKSADGASKKTGTRAAV
ncbi:MAG: cation diffusion facilitator family transporter [Rhodospirillaceae bacterium]